jgi:hypothetical protein
VQFIRSNDKIARYLMTMSSVISLPFKLWIIINLACFISSEIPSQQFVLHKELSISTKASDVSEIGSPSAIACAGVCMRNNLCHRASYDRMTKRCRIFNDQTNRNCDVGLDVVQTSVFLKTVDGKLCNFNRFPLVANIYVNKGNNNITELRTILQRESQNS